MKGELNHLQTSHEWRGIQVEKLMEEKRGLLDLINYEKKEPKNYTDSILLDAERMYSDAFVLIEKIKEKKR